MTGGGGRVILFSEDDGINSRHKNTKTKVEKLGHMKFRGHAAEIKNKSEIPSLEKFIGMKQPRPQGFSLLHRVITCTVYHL